jgi:nucleotide-binding universal stress UspA family protein
MTYATLMVHADCGDQAETRVRLAVNIAGLFDAMVIGVGAEPDLTAQELVDVLGSKREEKALRAEIVRARHLFEPIASFAAAGCQWRSGADFADQVLIRESRAADLIIMAPASRTQEALRLGVDPGDVLMGSGRPVLIAPPGLTSLTPCRIVVGWKDSRESRRAMSDALPFLKLATQVRVVEVCDGRFAPDAEARVADVAASLGRHGVNASGEVIAGQDLDAATALRDLCNAWEADLLVVGGYGHSRASEWIFGGVTRDLLKGGATPVLLGH